MDLEPWFLSAPAVPFSTPNGFLRDPFLGSFLDPLLLAFPGLLGRSKIRPGCALDDFVEILAPEWVPKWRPKWVTERFRCEQQR